jgi:hypothetical protein
MEFTFRLCDDGIHLKQIPCSHEFFLGIGPKALSSHHIWTFIPSVHPSVCPYPPPFFPMDGLNIHM